jgi:hypothetical protein
MAFQTLVVLLGLLLTCHVRATCRFDSHCAQLMFLGVDGMNNCVTCDVENIDCDVCTPGYGLDAGACAICGDTQYSIGTTTCLNA